jgi:hypothetical protein
MLIVAIRRRMVVRVAVLAGAILVMPCSHALRCRNRSHPLNGDGQGQQEHSKKSEKTFRHRRAL